MRLLDLDNLKKGYPGISKNVGAFLSESGAFCFVRANHNNGVQLPINGFCDETFSVIWSDEITPQIFRTWNDTKDATEFGATAVAVCLVEQLFE